MQITTNQISQNGNSKLTEYATGKSGLQKVSAPPAPPKNICISHDFQMCFIFFSFPSAIIPIPQTTG